MSKEAFHLVIQLKLPAHHHLLILEYVGYLMTEHYSHKSNKDYIFVYKDGEPVPGSASNLMAHYSFMSQLHVLEFLVHFML